MAKEILALIILPLDNNKIVVIIIKITEILLVGANIYRVLTISQDKHFHVVNEELEVGEG